MVVVIVYDMDIEDLIIIITGVIIMDMMIIHIMNGILHGDIYIIYGNI